MPQLQDKLAYQLRAAVLAADHEKAARLTMEYCEALREHWMTLSAEERAVSALQKQSLELLTWVREMTIMQRALAAEHLRMIEKAKRYRTARSHYLQSGARNTR